METFIIAFLLSLFAGLSTSIGSLFTFFIKKPKPAVLSYIMGFSAGVMILVSFIEILPVSIESIGLLFSLLFFFLGMIIMFLIDINISHYYEFENKYGNLNSESNLSEDQKHNRNGRKQYESLRKSTILIAIGVFVHNLPEGMATFVGTLKDLELGVMLAIAIALHNIPEGIAVAIPVYTIYNNRKKAFLWSFITGISEPIGAIVVWLIFFPFINDFLINAMLSVVAGFMIYISLDELLPASHSLGKEHISILGIISGMFAISISMILL